jgi:hypothetical protein
MSPSFEAPEGLAGAIKIMAKEKSLAEQFVVILNTVGKGDVKQYARGIELYAEAKAEFDGLIEGMKTNLELGEPLRESLDFKNSLRTAVDNRWAFTSYIKENIIGDEQGKRFPYEDIIKDAAELISKLTDAAFKIWKEYRNSADKEKQAIRSQLDGVKWKPYSEIGGA